MDTLFGVEQDQQVDAVAEWGTFRDSLKAPIHGWFTYPAGFSFKAVEHSLRRSGIPLGSGVVYDPFMGSGTTNLVAKQLGYNSYGVEAHPFVFKITQTKMEWELSFNVVNDYLQQIHRHIKSLPIQNGLEEFLKSQFPELILKCFLPETLYELYLIRNSINVVVEDEKYRSFFRTALVCVLRDVSIAATGWPYIAPNKVKITSMSKKGWETYCKRALKMINDIKETRGKAFSGESFHKIFNGDSRDTSKYIDSNVADHIFTSPPYLNNFDYADRTRLEMYFMGDAKNWGEISNQIRTKLMTSATTQIGRTDLRYVLNSDFELLDPELYDFLSSSIVKLGELRNVKGGKKSYDLLVAGYFNDMLDILRDNFRILKEGSKALYILGDSAPYGVHIPTDEIIGKIGVAIGFKSYNIQLLRTRGGKWASNPQRHSVALRETIVELVK